MNPLSDVLSLLKPRSYVAGGFDVGGSLAVRFGQHDGVKCYSVVSGQVWLQVEGVSEPVRLRTGDCFLLPRGWPFRLATDLEAPPVDALSLLASARRSGGVLIVNGGGECVVIGGHFALTGEHAGMLLGALPPIVHIQKESDKAAMRWSLERMRQELREGEPGGFLMAQHLAHLMLLQALRLHLAEGSGTSVGWLFALSDKHIGAAISAVHDAPAHPWTLQTLAERAGMSRSTFALRFKERVGESPMEYLTRWRMLLAGDRLMNSSDPVSLIARSLGYESESAFSTAFKRVMGRSPRQYGRRSPRASLKSGAGEGASAKRLEPVAG
jgi:AraC-like DNA-binding protein